MDQWTCKHCGEKNDADCDFCFGCGVYDSDEKARIKRQPNHPPGERHPRPAGSPAAGEDDRQELNTQSMIEKLKPRSVNPPATNEQIARLESRIGQQIPDRLRALLGESNGVWAGDLQILEEACPGGMLANGFYSTSEMEENLQVYGARISDDLLAFANDQCGNEICIGIKGPRRGKIYFWDHEEDVVGGLEMGFDVDPSAIHQNEFLVADSLDEFISLFVDWDVG